MALILQAGQQNDYNRKTQSRQLRGIGHYGLAVNGRRRRAWLSMMYDGLLMPGSIRYHLMLAAGAGFVLGIALAFDSRRRR